ncbi:aldolase/citrate lyase family protein [Paracoccus pacificus]|uniref:Aldolase/citrate lyase family protein n=1 Tax=Paracoccus pacificus TaxID=1463598 RepID=A0ABW4R4K7_9RHOB
MRGTKSPSEPRPRSPRPRRSCAPRRSSFRWSRPDLAASLGHLGDPGHDKVQAALRGALEPLQRIGKPAGILARNAEEARRYRDWGYRFVACGVDLALLIKAADTLAASMAE